MIEEHNDWEQDKLLAEMEKLSVQGCACFVKWTCEGCGERVTCDKPNTFFTKGFRHTMKSDNTHCGHISFPTKFGLMIMTAIIPSGAGQ